MGSGNAAALDMNTPERGALLRWMIFTGLSIFAAVLLWRYGLIHLMAVSDRTYISSLIGVLYLATCGHCFWRTRAIAREDEAARRCRALLSAPGADAALDPDAAALPKGLVRDHIRSLVIKATAQGSATSIRRCYCGRWPIGCAVRTVSAHSFPI